jgi:hypothetical protein
VGPELCAGEATEPAKTAMGGVGAGLTVMVASPRLETGMLKTKTAVDFSPGFSEPVNGLLAGSPVTWIPGVPALP